MTAIVTNSIDFSLAWVTINSVDISQWCKKITFPSKWINNDVTAFGASGRRYAPGIDETKFTIEMWFNQVASNGSHTVVGAVHAAKTTVAFAFAPAGNVSGNLKIYGNCSIPEYETTAQVGSAQQVVAVCDVDNGVTYGTV
jgi:hypothetical protein